MKKPIEIMVVGAGGRVGQELLKLIQESLGQYSPFCGVGHRAQGFAHNLREISEVIPHLPDLLIDFSSPELFSKALQFCKQNKIPFVSGTTGLLDSHHEEMKTAAMEIPVLWSPNMSLGVAVLKRALAVFGGIKDFDYQIEEWHHRHKKDRPSGTALMLQNKLEGTIEKSVPPTMVLRGGGIFGVHKVYAVSADEMIQFEHTALNRSLFARGALVGAQWLVEKEKGLYSIDDVLPDPFSN